VRNVRRGLTVLGTAVALIGLSLGPARAAGGPTLAEKDVNLDEALRLGGLLHSAGFEVDFTRVREQTVSLADRTNAGRGYDVFVSVHNNSSSNHGVHGTEIYYQVGNNDGAQLAAQLLDHVSKAAGTTARFTMARRGNQGDYYYVLRNSPETAVIVEGAYLSNSDEAHELNDPNFRQRLAQGIFDGLVARLGLVRFHAGDGPPPPNSTPAGPVLPAPSQVAAVRTGPGLAAVTWDPVAQATGYEVWRDGSLAATIGAPSATTVSWGDTGLAAGLHHYDVRAFVEVAGHRLTESNATPAEVIMPWRVMLDPGHGGQDPGSIGHL
jgi:N-acetylmuramoyl-L-alanine amidase